MPTRRDRNLQCMKETHCHADANSAFFSGGATQESHIMPITCGCSQKEMRRTTQQGIGLQATSSNPKRGATVRRSTRAACGRGIITPVRSSQHHQEFGPELWPNDGDMAAPRASMVGRPAPIPSKDDGACPFYYRNRHSLYRSVQEDSRPPRVCIDR